MVRLLRTILGFVAALFAATFIISCGRSGEETSSAHTLPDSVYAKAGDVLIARTFDTLRNSLLDAVGRKGFPGAISFCQVNAGTLTSVYADSVVVRRTSMRYRNVDNQPDSLERAMLTTMAADPVAHPRLVRSLQEIHYFKPIIMQAMCVNCHGTPGVELLPETEAALKAAYPNDMATGYKAGDLRGVWHIIFKQKGVQ